MKKEPLIVFIFILFLLVSCRVKDENIESAIFAPVNYVGKKTIVSSHNIRITCDAETTEVSPNEDIEAF